MDLYLFIDVKNPEVHDESQVWLDQQKNAVYRAICLFKKKNIEKVDHRLKVFSQDQCIGESFSIIFEHHRGDKRDIDDVVTEANVLYEYLRSECESVGLVVSQHSSV